MSLISILFITLVFLIQFSFASHSNVYAVSLAQINLQLPNLYINFGPRPYYWLRFLNGTLQSKNGPFHSAIINRRFINGDFNNDGYADAAVLVKLNYNSSGYFNTFVVAVIQDYNGGPQVPIPVIVGSIAIEDIKTFTWDQANSRIVLQYLDRVIQTPGDTAKNLKIKPTKPTVQTIKVTKHAGKYYLSSAGKTTYAKSCWPF